MVNQTIRGGLVTSGSPVLIDIPRSAQLEVFNSSYSERRKGIHVTSSGSIFLLAENYIIGINHGVFLAYPCLTLEQNLNYEYYAISKEGLANLTRSQILLVGCENDTTITITPSRNVRFPLNLQEESSLVTVNAGTTSQAMVLHQMQTLLVSSFDDLTGTRITSNKPLSVISGHECANNPSASLACEPFAVQVPPTRMWGRRFLLSPFAGRNNVRDFKLVSPTPTSVNYTCANNWFSFHNKTTFEFSTSDYCYLESTEPLLLIQLSTDDHNVIGGDPAFTLISPIDSYISEVSFAAQSSVSFSTNYISVTVLAEHFNSSSITLDNQILNCSWERIFDTQLEVIGYGCSESVTVAMYNPTLHTVRHQNGLLSVLAYGFNTGPRLGYAYLTGQNLQGT